MRVVVSAFLVDMSLANADRHQSPPVDPANIVQALVYTLLDVFDAARDLHQTLKVKEKRDYELSLRSKRYPPSRRIEYVEDESLGKDEDLVMDKAAVTRRKCQYSRYCLRNNYGLVTYFPIEFEIGLEKVGRQFAVGDSELYQSRISAEYLANATIQT
jgi:hypothetical protein